MEYPDAIITKPIRTAIMIFTIILFFILAPLLIMYTSGYRYDWKRGLLKETGAFNINIEPKHSSIFINDVLIKQKMPLKLSNLIPNKYNVLISAPGYFDWQKEVEIKNKQTLYIKEISLLKDTEPVLLIPEKAENLTITFDGNYLIYSKINEDNNTEIHLLTISNLSDTILLTLKEVNKIQIIFNKFNNYFIISNDTEPYEIFYIFNTNDLTKKIDLVAKHQRLITKFQWRESTTPELYYSTEEQIMSILPNTEQRFNLSKNIYLDWQMENNKLWTIQLSTSTKKIKIYQDTLGANEEIFSENYFNQDEQNITILNAKNNNLLLKKKEQAEMIILTLDEKFNISGDNFKVSKFNNWWLIWSPWELWGYSINKEPVLLNRSGEKLNQIEPLDKYNTLALVWENKVTALYPYYLVTHNLLENKIYSITTDTKTKKIFFSANINNQDGIWFLNY